MVEIPREDLFHRKIFQEQTRQTPTGDRPLPPTREAEVWGPDPGTGQVWTSERFREVLKRETSTSLDWIINIAAYQDIAIGISRRFSRRFIQPSSAFASNIQKKRELTTTVLNTDAENDMDKE
ncbi:hypothetical protein BBP40_009878 [Aspergillus hancockii]|nr:hypothetical protein BBP40_009878 [Aspergillus hancockii]